MQFYCIGGSENQSVSGVTTICLTQCNTSPLHRVDQVVDCGLWNVGPLQWLCEVAGYWQEQEHAVVYANPEHPKKCSMDDMSGECAGHARTGMFSASSNCVQILSTWGRALSCCNMR